MTMTARPAWWLGALSCALLGCGSTPRTEVVLVVDSNLCVPARLTAVRFEVGSTDGLRPIGPIALTSPNQLPLTLGVSTRGRTADFRATVWGTVDGAEMVSRVAHVQFVPEQTMMLRLDLTAQCVGMGCGGQTCSAGTCRSIEVQPSELVPWSGPPARLYGVERLCANFTDDDCDGQTDCMDPDCAAAPGCTSCVMTEPTEFSCADLMDNDCDGSIDCADPNCIGVGVCVCVSTEPTEFSCADGNDNDCDTFVDCADPDCAAGGACACLGVAASGGCGAGGDLGTRAPPFCLTGDTTGLGDWVSASGCAGTAPGGSDMSFWWSAPWAGTFTFSTLGSSFDTVLYAQTDCMGGAVLGCANAGFDETLTLDLSAAQRVVVVVDGNGSASRGPFQLRITWP